MNRPARMSPAEAVMLCRFAKAACPQQAFDEYTPDAWFELLNDLRFEDCKDAVVAVVKRSPFCSPSEIRAEVKRIRFKRISDFGPFEPPAGIAGDWREGEYRDWMRDMHQEIADGLTREEYDAANPLSPSKPMPALDAVFKRLEDIDPTAIEVEGDWSEPA